MLLAITLNREPEGSHPPHRTIQQDALLGLGGHSALFAQAGASCFYAWRAIHGPAGLAALRPPVAPPGSRLRALCGEVRVSRRKPIPWRRRAGIPVTPQERNEFNRAVTWSLPDDPRETAPVKLIIAIIQPHKLESVKEALSEVEVFRLTVLDVQGFGRQRGHAETYRGHEIAVNLLRKVQLQIAVNDDFVEPTIAAIVNGGRTGERGEIGDGKIFVLPMDECVRIRTGERGSEAI